MGMIINQLLLLFITCAFNQATGTLTTLLRLASSCFQRPKSSIDALKTCLQRLECKKTDIVEKTKTIEGKREVWRGEIDDWLQKVADVQKDSNQVINSDIPFDASFVINCVRINIASIGLCARVKNLFEEGCKLDVVGKKPPPKVDISGYVGLEPYLMRIGELLVGDEVSIIGITGLGGIGKTTLLKKIKNELQPGGSLSSRCKFDLIIWVRVGMGRKFEDLQRKIAKVLQLSLDRYDDSEVIASAINEHLKGKNFVLFLDDLWEYFDLGEVGFPVDQPDKQFKCKIIFSTRSQNLCFHMEANWVMLIDCLSDKDAWFLFKENVPEEILFDERVQPIAKSIARMCRGLPLALTIVGRAMSSKSKLKEWQDILLYLERQQDIELDFPFCSVLKISYDLLHDDTEKQCFLSCALWPEHCQLDVHKLIESWIGLGFLDNSLSKGIDDAYRRGYFLVERLEDAALLEHVDDNEVWQVNMHPVVRDMAREIAVVEGGKWIVGSEAFSYDREKAHRVSMINSGMEELPDLCYSSELLSLMLQMNRSLTKVDRSLFKLLVSLQYLDISHTGITELPEEIGLLQSLLYLNLSYSPISYLLYTLNKLRKLRFLLLRGTDYLVEIPHGLISNLPKLLVLDLFESEFSEWGEGGVPEKDEIENRATVEEFRHLAAGLQSLGISLRTFDALLQLSNTPGISTRSLEITGCNEEVNVAKMLDLFSTSPNLGKKIQELKIKGCNCPDFVTIAGGSSLPELETLCLWNLAYLREIIWKQVEPGQPVASIRKLSIFFCHRLENISWVLQLPKLEHLQLFHCKSMKHVVKEENMRSLVKNPFLCLKEMKFKYLPNLTSISDGEYTFPCLKTLEVSRCQKLEKLPLGLQIITNKSLIIRGYNTWWTQVMANVENEGSQALSQRRLQTMGSN